MISLYICPLDGDGKRLPFQLRKAVIDHVSDSFLETNVPLMLLIEAAEAGNEKEVEECAVVFTEHAAKLEEVPYISSHSTDMHRQLVY